MHSLLVYLDKQFLKTFSITLSKSGCSDSRLQNICNTFHITVTISKAGGRVITLWVIWAGITFPMLSCHHDGMLKSQKD